MRHGRHRWLSGEGPCGGPCPGGCVGVGATVNGLAGGRADVCKGVGCSCCDCGDQVGDDLRKGIGGCHRGGAVAVVYEGG